MRAQGNPLLSTRFLQTLWAPFTATPRGFSAPVIGGPYSKEVHATLNLALSNAKCPDQSSSSIWNGQYCSFPAAPLTPAAAATHGEQQQQQPTKELHAIHNYFAIMLSGYNIHSTEVAIPDIIANRSVSNKPQSHFKSCPAESGKASGTFLLKQERPLLGVWKSSNPYLKVDFSMKFESRGGYFLHLGYHCNFHQQLLENGCPPELAMQLLQGRPSDFVLTHSGDYLAKLLAEEQHGKGQDPPVVVPDMSDHTQAFSKNMSQCFSTNQMDMPAH